MSIFNNVFGSNNRAPQGSKIDWQYITNPDQLRTLAEELTEKPAIVFKHSTRCPISKMALRTFEREFDLEDKVTPYLLDLLENRDVSDEIAKRFEVVHHSPQLLLIKNGASVYDVSHDSITVDDLKKHL